MTTPTKPEVGQKWVRSVPDYRMTYRIREVNDETVTMYDYYTKQVVEETLERFMSEVERGRAVLHPKCEACGLPYDPEEPDDGPLHFECWFQSEATVQERCEAEHNRPGGSMIASEALRSDKDPTEYLLEVIGDPKRQLFERHDADNLLAYRVSTQDRIDAWFNCPNCREGEVFEMVPETGAVFCHCGEQVAPPDNAT